MADRQKLSSLIVQTEYGPTPLVRLSSLIVQTEYGPTPLVRLSSLIVQCELSSGEPPYDDGTPSGGIVFGGEVVEVASINYTDLSASGGIVFGGEETSAETNYMTEAVSSGGIVFGGEAAELWETTPYNSVAVKGGTYRILGVLYTIANIMSFPGVGSIAALVDCAAAPSSAGLWRYDLLSIDDTGAITVTAGTEAATPVMPVTPTGELKLNHVLRYYGQDRIQQSDIGRIYTAPVLSFLTVTVTDDELSWAEASTTITVTCRDQYGQLFTGGKTVNAAFLSGNGTITPLSRSGAASSFTFTYTRDQEVTDVSPVIQFTSPIGPMAVVRITVLDDSGDPMF